MRAAGGSVPLHRGTQPVPGAGYFLIFASSKRQFANACGFFSSGALSNLNRSTMGEQRVSCFDQTARSQITRFSVHHEAHQGRNDEEDFRSSSSGRHRVCFAGCDRRGRNVSPPPPSSSSSLTWLIQNGPLIGAIFCAH
jgi:hypothetical protein